MRFPRIREEDGSCAAARCSLCGEEIYAGEEAWRVSGETVCPGCFGTFARQWFAPFAFTVGVSEQ